MTRPAVLAGLLLWCAGVCSGQQPFVTDDAEVTEKGRLHLQYSNELDILQKDAYPNRRQDTSNFVIQYGLFERVEVNMDFPLIAIENARGSGTPGVFGLGDVDFAVKWNILQEKADRGRPAFAVSAAAEFPTGSERKQLGSGLTDYSVNTILQKTFSGTQVHVNAGVQFSGNTRTGAVGIRTPGRILIGGVSAARDVSGKLRLGLDFNGAEVHDGGRVEKQILLTAGGNYALFRGGTLDFAVLAGWYSAPRAGVTLGISLFP